MRKLQKHYYNTACAGNRNQQNSWSPNASDTEKQIAFEMPIMGGGRQQASFRNVKSMKLLGCMVDATGTPQSLIHNRLASAQRAFWAKPRIWRGRSKRVDKLAAWVRHIRPIAIHGLRSLHVSRQFLHTICKWGVDMLREMMKLRRRCWKTKAGETNLESNKRFYKKN